MITLCPILRAEVQGKFFPARRPRAADDGEIRSNSQTSFIV